MRSLALLGAAAALVCVLPPSTTATTAPSCGVRTVGPGGLRHGAGDGPACMLAAFGHGCRPIAYRLSVFGLDTIASTLFTLARLHGRCRVVVVSSFEVVPRLKTIRRGTCAALSARPPGVFATGCSAVLGRQVSLSGSG